MNKLTGNEKVYLYKREFFGIDKECDKKYNLNENTYNIIHYSEQSEYYLLLIEGIFTVCFSSIYFLIETMRFCRKGYDKDEDGKDFIPEKAHCALYSIYMGLLFSCFICHIVFYYRLTKNDLTGYNCSDVITNEILRIGFEGSNRNIYFIKVNYYLELVLVLGNVIMVLIISIWEGIENCLLLKNLNSNEESKEKEENEEKKENEENEEPDNNENSETNTAQIPLNKDYPGPNN